MDLGVEGLEIRAAHGDADGALVALDVERLHAAVGEEGGQTSQGALHDRDAGEDRARLLPSEAFELVPLDLQGHRLPAGCDPRSIAGDESHVGSERALGNERG